jgi:DNA-binding LacI/PurR family transcriptional regulator
MPYAPARSLRLGRTNIVLALVRDYDIGYIADFALRRLDVALAETGHILLVHRYHEEEQPLSSLWKLLTPTVVVAMGGLSLPDLSSIRQSSVGFVRVQGMLPHARAGEMQVDHLCGRNHRRIGYAYPANPSVELMAKARLAGARRAARRHGIPDLDVRIVDPADPQTTFAALSSWRAAEGGVTAVCAHNDEIALGLVSGLRAMGLQPGKELALVGVDNIPLARIELTTIEINVSSYTDWIVESVMAALGEGPRAHKPKELMRLIIRQTT